MVLSLRRSLVVLRTSENPVEDSCDDGSNDGGNPEEPQLTDGPSSVEDCGGGTTGWVYRCVGDRDADQVNEGEAEPDGDGCQPCRSSFVCGTEDDEEKHERHD